MTFPPNATSNGAIILKLWMKFRKNVEQLSCPLAAEATESRIRGYLTKLLHSYVGMAPYFDHL